MNHYNYTPAPWHLEEQRTSLSRAGRVDVVSQDGHTKIVSFGPRKNWDKIDEGNANIITAAPELYEALRDLVRLVQVEYENPQNIVSGQQLRALEVLAKAEGRL